MQFLFHHYHRKSISRAGQGPPTLPADWPKEWKTIYYKSYQNVPILPLTDIVPPAADFFALSAKRASVRGGHGKGISVSDLSLMLKYSCGLQNKARRASGVKLRAQPSGGARFPLEAYILSLKKENGVATGVYHYNVKKHGLDTLCVRDFSHEDIARLFTYPWSVDCSMALIITAVFERSSPKYGERAYRFALIEAGHIGQGVYLAGESCGVGVTGMGGVREEALHELLDIDGTQEALVYALMLSK